MSEKRPPKVIVIAQARHIGRPATLPVDKTEHHAFLNQLLAQRVLLAAGPDDETTGGTLVLSGANRAAIEALLACDPLVREGLLRYSCRSFAPTRVIPELEVSTAPSPRRTQ